MPFYLEKYLKFPFGSKHQGLLLGNDCEMVEGSVLLSQTVIRNQHTFGGLKYQKCIVSQLWWQEVQNGRVSRAVPPPKTVAGSPSWSLPALGSGYSLVCGHLTPVSAYMFIWPSLLSVSSLLSLIKTPIIGFRAHAHDPECSHLDP